MSISSSIWSPPLPEVAGFEHQVIETPGLHTHLAAIGEGVPVVLLHGFPQHWWQWRVIAPLIASNGYRVYCPDLRGAGWTVAKEPGVNRTARLHDLLALFDALSIENAHILSHDMGAITAMQLSYDFPERVRTAMELSVPPGFMAFSPRVMSGFRHLPRFIWHRPGASLSGIFSEAYVAHPLPDSTIAEHLAPMRRTEVDDAVRRLTRGMILPEAARLGQGVYRRRRLTVPTRFVFGSQDHPWTKDNMLRTCRNPERYADCIDFSYVDDAAHFITDDAPAAVAHLAIDWFAQAP